mmetsp:Transcript_52072/g.118669  ORF Transcript_52072/g.118669 Transcript_52072/m.118669 type:complete len:760 (+) Transcript_52072:851-3130(+)
MGWKKADLLKKLAEAGLHADDTDSEAEEGGDGVSGEEAEEAIDADDAELFLLELGFKVRRMKRSKSSELASRTLASGDLSSFPRRAPVVTVMGHVDAGKTTLLDALRNDAFKSLAAAAALVAPAPSGRAAKKAAGKKAQANRGQGPSGSALVSEEAASEAGGITQRVAAFHVTTRTAEAAADEGEGGVGDPAPADPAPGFMTVVDTPGHAAFGAMRASGVSATDVLVCVIAADAGIQPQTEEVLDLCRSHDCGLVVAVTKCDKFAGDEREQKKAVENIRAELMSRGWVSEADGGDVMLVCVSGKTGEGLEDLKEAVSLQAEVLDLRALVDGPAEGVVLEASMEKGHGPVVDLLVTWGTLKVGDHVVVGREFGKVRRLLAAGSEALDAVGPARAARVVGLRGLPEAGLPLQAVRDEARARAMVKLRLDQFVAQRLLETKEVEMAQGHEISARTGLLSNFARRRQRMQAARLRAKLKAEAHAAGKDVAEVLAAADGQASSGGGELKLGLIPRVPQFPVVVKVDSQGSAAAIMELIAAIPDTKVSVQVVHLDVGPVTTGDLDLAAAAAEDRGGSWAETAHLTTKGGGGKASAGAIPGAAVSGALGPAPVLAFNVGPNGGDVSALAKKHKISIRRHRVIYALIDDLKALLTDSIPAVVEDRAEGEAEVKQVFEIGKKGGGKIMVAGCQVTQGRLVSEGGCFRVKRQGEVIHAQFGGAMLKHYQNEVPEVKYGTECGVALTYDSFEAGDTIECFTQVKVEQTLD